MATSEQSLLIRKIISYSFLQDPQRFSIGLAVGYAAHAFTDSISRHYNLILLSAACETGWIAWSIFCVLLFSWKTVAIAITSKPSFEPEIEKLLKALAILDANNAPQHQRNKVTETIVKILIDQSNNESLINMKRILSKEIAK